MPFTCSPQSAHMRHMDIFQIWARDSDSPTASKWLIDAWDDDSISSNAEGYAEALSKAREEHGADNVAVIVQAVNMDLVDAAFLPTRIPPADAVPAERWKQMYINEARCRDVVSCDRDNVANMLRSVRRLAHESDSTIDRQDILDALKVLDQTPEDDRSLLDSAAWAIANTVLPKPYTSEQLCKAHAAAALGAAGHSIEIATVEQRDALPVGSALLDPQGICVKYYGYWARANAVGEWSPSLPATLIHYGDGPIEGSK